jgi:protein phosphatase
MSDPSLPFSHYNEHGPLDIIGDIHGCYDELSDLLTSLGWQNSGTPSSPHLTNPTGRKVVFLGDLVDRGPGVTNVLRLVMSMVQSGYALCLLGNHDDKLMRKLMGRNVKIAHGLAETLEQLAREPYSFMNQLLDFLTGLSTYQILDYGKLIVTHAAIKASMIGKWNGGVRAFTMYGDATGEYDEFGLPIRRDWASEYTGEPVVVYGHTPVREPIWVNNTIDIDTGCVFGGSLTALRYPENDLISIPARKTYFARAGGIR